MAVICGAKIIPIITTPDSNYTASAIDIENSITKKTKAIALVSPSNPTGTVIKKELIKEIYNLSLKYNLLLITDEIYEHYVFDDHVHYSINSDFPKKNNVISIWHFVYLKSRALSNLGWKVKTLE